MLESANAVAGRQPELCPFSLWRRSRSRTPQAKLRRRRIDSRLGYGEGVHRQTRLPVTEAVAPHLLGLTVAEDPGEREVGRVVGDLVQGLARTAETAPCAPSART